MYLKGYGQRAFVTFGFAALFIGGIIRALPATANDQFNDSSGQLADWRKLVTQHLQRHKLYPPGAEIRGEEGVVTLAFSVDRNGKVLSQRIVESSGHFELDQEVLALIQRAQPLPAFLGAVPPPSLNLRLPIRFNLGKASSDKSIAQIPAQILAVEQRPFFVDERHDIKDYVLNKKFDPREKDTAVFSVTTNSTQSGKAMGTANWTVRCSEASPWVRSEPQGYMYDMRKDANAKFEENRQSRISGLWWAACKSMYARNVSASTAGQSAEPTALSGECKKLNERAESKFRYLLCSEGFFDRRVNGFLLRIEKGKVTLPISQYPDRGFEMRIASVPKRFENLIFLRGNNQKALVWADEDEPIFLVDGDNELLSTHIVSTKFIDQNGLFIGAKPEQSWVKGFRRTCTWGEGNLTCPLKFIRTNSPYYTYYFAGAERTGKPNLIEMIVLGHIPRP